MLEEKPLVSVIIPTRNRKKFVQFALQSVLAQTYKNLQIIVHDNNSTDGTEEFLEKELTDPRVEYYRVTSDLSMTENWNTAFKYVKGVLFTRLDDDNVFSNDFVEACVDNIQKGGFDVFMYSPLNINVKDNMYSMFLPDAKIWNLTKYQFLYLEYFNFTDSNYVLYKKEVVDEVFPDGDIYQTTLPDRYLNYFIAALPNIHIGMSTLLKGVTRFDYRDPLTNTENLTYYSYENADIESLVEKRDCHENFSMHRVSVLQRFLSKAHDTDIENFCNQFLVHEDFYPTVARLGHLYSVRGVDSQKELKAYAHYLWEIIRDFFQHSGKCFEGKKGTGVLLITYWKLYIGLGVSLLYTLFGFQKEKIIANEQKGNEIVQSIIQGVAVDHYKARSLFGSLEKNLENVTQYKM